MRTLPDGVAAPSTIGIPLTLYSRITRRAVRDRRRRRQRDRIDDHAVFAALHLLHFAGLILDRKILMNDPDPPFLRQRDRQRRFRDRVHRSRDQRDIQLNLAGEPGMRIGIGGNKIAPGGNQQHVVKGNPVVDDLGVFHRILLRPRPPPVKQNSPRRDTARINRGV